MNLRRSTHLVYLGCGLPVVAVYLFVGPVTQAVLYGVLGLAAAAASIAAAVRLRGWSRVSWLLLGLGISLFVGGDSISSWYQLARGALPFPSIADAVYLVGYLTILAGLLVVAARRSFRGCLLDSATLAAAIAFLGTVLLVEPSSGGFDLGSLVAVAYPSMDVLLLSLVALVVLGGVGAAQRWLLASVAALLVTDLVYAQMQTYGGYDGGAIDLGWLVSYVLWGATALHAELDVAMPSRSPRGLELVAPVVGVAALPVALVAETALRGRVEPYATAAGGAALAALAIARLSHLVRSERSSRAEVQRSELHFRSLIENSTDVFSILDGAGTVLYQSPSLARVLGYEPHELVGRDSSELIHQEDLAVMREELARLLSEPHAVVSAELRTRHKDGHWVLLEATGTNRLHDPAVGGLVVCSRDVSRQRAAEAEQLRLQQELHHAQKMDAIGRLAGGVAHDFNNLLMVMSASTESALLELAGDNPIRVKLDQTAHAVGRAAALTQQLLTFSRRQQPSLRPIDLNEQIETTCAMLRRLLGENVTVELELGHDLPAISADPGELDQVLLNLALNARDAMPAGGTVRFRTAAGADGTVELEVADDGIGMDEATREQLFEPFLTTKQPGSGTGLGLATVYGIVTRSGGSIHVQSVPGRGSSFVLTLPSADRHRAAAAERLPAAAAAAGGERILLVEDEQTVRNVVREGLEQHGYRVVDTGDPRAALELARSEEIDVLVTDVRMPHMDGFELYDRLRDSSPDLRAVFISGYSETTYDASISRGATVFVEKPFAISDLTHRLRGLLDTRVPLAASVD